MIINARASGATMHLESNPQDKTATERQSVVFALLPMEDGDHLDLDTGEVFEDSGYARVRNREPKLIHATMEVRPGKDNEDCAHSSMLYIDEHKNEYEFDPAKIFFNVCIPPQTFRELAANTRSGLLPFITFGFDDPPYFKVREPPKVHPLQYGWEPDGSGVIWHNKEHRRVAIESVRFDYIIAEARHDEELERPLASHEPRRDAAVQPPKQEKNVVANRMAFPQWYSKGQLSAGEGQILALVSFIGGAILISLSGIKP